MKVSILIIDDELKMGKALKLVLEKEGYSVDITEYPQTGLDLLARTPYQVLLCDLRMPGMGGLDVLERAKALQPHVNVIMMTAYASAETAVESMKRGAYDYLIKPFSTDELKILIQRCLRAQALQEENALLKERLQEKYQPENTIAASKAMQLVLNRARKVAESNATVLIRGESGTGKEMLAGIIHTASARAGRPIVTVNCGALPESLLEAELFGHRRGAFTGAVENRQGLFEAADGGTIFLDEIGEISPAMQVKLLRVLQSGEFQRVGDPSVVRVDVRVLAATNRDLEKMVAEGKFRTDLYYRLNVVPLFIPPLRERREDIAPLIEHFIRKFGRGRPFRFTPAALDLMERYTWPGNIRELENAVEHAIVLSDVETLGIEWLPTAVRSLAEEARDEPVAAHLDNLTLEEAEKRMIRAAMARTGYNTTRAAKQLGVTRRTLGYRLRKHGLHRGISDAGEEEEPTGSAGGEERQESHDSPTG